MANVYGVDGAAAVTLLLRISIAFRACQKMSLSMRTLTMKSVISRMSTGSGGVRQMVRLRLKPSLKLKLI